eukprot:TRINITY_DN7562_c0_g1_i1.p1 TRINITY_DN7562_c0_g1~~TRINITY_DN7562_c0_g1_i1.p1  ORF type:complete len:336 (-),score=85.38 TRINITY_DN7562_c0_g1_i1:152-1159(-)
MKRQIKVKRGKGRGNARELLGSKELLQKAEKAIERFEYDKAVNFYTRALELEPTNTSIMDDMAEILLEMGDFTNAHQLLSRSIQLEPTSGAGKWLNFGQLVAAADAVTSFQKGIEILLQEKTKTTSEEEITKINKQLCTACCSIAEIYMTDLCDEETAEASCVEWVGKAIECDPQNPEGHQALASLSLSQKLTDKAKSALQTSISLWEPKEREEWPSISFRLATSKLLMEVGENEKAAEVLVSILEEDAQLIDANFLLGFAYSKFDPAEAKAIWTHTLSMIAKDPEGNECIKEEIEKGLSTLPQVDETQMVANGEEEEGEEAWEDLDDDGDLMDT